MKEQVKRLKALPHSAVYNAKINQLERVIEEQEQMMNKLNSNELESYQESSGVMNDG